MGCHSFILLFCFFHFWCVFLSHAQLQSSQSQVLLQIKKQLEHPKQLETWENRHSAFCSSSSSPSSLVNVTCENNLVTELSIIGDTSHHTHMTSSKSRDFFYGFSIPNRTLSENFSIDSFVVTLARLTSLKTLRLVYLGIWGPFPSKIHRLFQLEHLDLSSNFLYGSIPPKISTILSLQILRLDDNFFNTTIPTWLFSLPNMTYLNLSSNELNGSLENHLHCGGKLRFVDISGNKLTGVLPSCLGAESAGRVVKCEGNCLSFNVQHQHEVSYCTEVHAVINKKKKTQKVGDRERVLVGVIVGVFVGIVVLGLGVLIVCRRYCSHKGLSEQHLLHKTVQDSNAAFGFSSEVFADERFISQASKLGREEAPMCRPYSFEEIKEATNNFDNSTFMGENLFGKIYRGKLENGKEVAIRRLALSKKYSLRNFKLRLDLLAKLRHPHLVSLLGHCIHGVVAEDHDATDIHIFLLYEYVPNGTFQSYLSGGNGGGGKVLNWTERLGVVTSIAKAVHFLHTGMIPGFFNNRLKSNNILLDHHFMPKLTDYGFSILSTDTSGGEGEGTKSWEMKRLEDDIYGFGFILLEALVGPSVSAKREANLLNVMASFDSQDGWKQIVDPIVQATCCRESLFIVISITNKCISSESWSRPTMEDVLLNLQNASQVQSNNTHHNVVRFVSSLREVSTISV